MSHHATLFMKVKVGKWLVSSTILTVPSYDDLEAQCSRDHQVYLRYKDQKLIIQMDFFSLPTYSNIHIVCITTMTRLWLILVSPS